MPNTPTTEQPRNDSGRFTRKENDLPISTVLAQEATKRTEKEAADKKRRETEDVDPKKKDALEEAGKQVLDEFLGIDREKDKSDLDAANKEKADKAKAEKEKKRAETDKREKQQKRDQDNQRPEIDVEKIASAAAEGVARVLKPKADPEKKVEEPSRPGPDARRLAVLERMEKLYPEEYKGAVNRYKTGKSKLETYRTQWEKDHAGEAFNEEDPEHEPFFEKNDLFEFWDEDAYLEASADLRAEKLIASKLEESSRETNAKLTELQRKDKLREAAEKISEEQTGAGREFWGAVDEEFADVVAPNGRVNNDLLKKMEEKDPVSFAHQIAAAEDLNLEVRTIYSLANGLVDYDAGNPVHVAMGKFGQDIERALLAKPAAERKNANGQAYLPAEDYYKLPKDKRDGYWTLTARDVSYRRARVLARETTQTIKRQEEMLEKFAASRGYQKPGSNKNGDHQHSEEREEEVEEQGRKPNSPSSGSESLLAARQNNPKNRQGSESNGFFRDLG